MSSEQSLYSVLVRDLVYCCSVRRSGSGTCCRVLEGVSCSLGDGCSVIFFSHRVTGSRFGASVLSGPLTKDLEKDRHLAPYLRTEYTLENEMVRNRISRV